MSDIPEGGRAARLMPVALWGGLVLALVAAVLLLLADRAQRHDRAWRGHLTELTVLAATLPAQAGAAGRGDEAGFASLSTSRTRLESLLAEIEAERAAFATWPASGDRRLGGETFWQTILASAGQVLDGRAAATELATWAEESRTGLGRVLAAAGNATSAPGGARALRELPRFESTAQRVADDLRLLATAPVDTTVIAGRITGNSTQLSQFLAGLAGEDPTAEVPALTGEAARRLPQAQDAFAAWQGQLGGTLERAGALAGAQQAGAELRRASAAVGRQLAGLASEDDGPGVLAGPYPALAALMLAVLAMTGGLLAWIAAAGLRQAAELEARRHRRNQEAILRLLDEMSSLASGDLTVQATVTDDFTGAIADSINFAIEALRDLVATINSTALQLDSAARQTQAAAGHLAKASVAQSRQVAAATDAVGAMAASIEEVSGNAERSADVARHAVDIAHKGGDAVRRTIDGMNIIRENIQDTSKRIKRLGESSQEIGNIVELINDIAEQTNILALNASIQASMAGDAGRGFAVVADEVQRLAERAGHATRQIEVLVRTIQTDTNEAVVSMERTTTDVVGGALLAENAGAALGEIEDVSNQIAQLVQNISASARQQAAASAHISRTMQILREISQQTADNTSATSNAIGRLAELSAQLRRSVAGFRLPQELPGPVPGPAARPVPEPPVRRASAGG